LWYRRIDIPATAVDGTAFPETIAGEKRQSFTAAAAGSANDAIPDERTNRFSLHAA
jgi:hypothetical protein